MQCHNKPVKAKDGRELDAVGDQLAESEYRHGPIKQEDCTPCHAVHGNDDPRLMKLAFPMGFYAPYEEDAYALCFGCHDPLLIDEEKSSSSGFRNGERNLHFVHVKQQKGRSCRACHHEHASNSPFQIRDWVMFGNWKMPIQYERTENGGTCLASCHTSRGYDRVNPIDNNPATKEE